MDTFVITDFTDGLSILSDKGSEIVADCPVCGTSGSLKINKRSSAYGLYKCDCSTKAVAKALTKQPEKAPRPKATKEWVYVSRDGEPLIKVTRRDDGHGGRRFFQNHWDGQGWKNGYGAIKRGQIPIYKYGAVRDAIANGETIYVVEGESCVDALSKLGLTATCNIGGSGKWLDVHAQDLKGAKEVVICPDRDWKGIDHAQAVAKSLEKSGVPVKWLYAPPSDIFWKPEKIQESGGLDVADWIGAEKIGKADIEGAIEDKPRDLSRPQKGNVVAFPTKSIEVAIDELIEKDLSGSKLTGAIADLADRHDRNSRDVRVQYFQRLQEVEQEDESEDTAAMVSKILEANNSRIEVGEVLPEDIAAPINQHANWLNLRPEVYMTSLLTGVSVLHHPETKLWLNRAWDFSVGPNLYSAIVAPSSQKKSPVLKAMVSKPLRLLQRKAREAHKEAIARFQEAEFEYDQLLQQAKKGDDAAKTELEELYPDGRPQQPTEKLYYFTSTSGEGIQYQASRHPDQGFLYEKDELAGVFTSANQYRGGRGSDSQDLLSYYDGTGAQNLRASGITASADNILLSVIGGIQPAILSQFLANCEDSDGQWARFMFVNQPIAPSQMHSDTGKHDLSPLIDSIYETLDGHKGHFPKEYYLAPDAFDLFAKAYNKLEQLRAAPTTTGAMANVYGKAEGRIGKLAINLHLLWAITEGQEVSPEVPKHIIQKAIKLTHFYNQQIESIYAQMSPEASLPANLAKVIEVAKGTGDWIGARDVSNRLSSADRKIYKAPHIRQWFGQLEEMGMGITEGAGRNMKFKFVSKSIQAGYKVGYNANPLQDKDSSPNVSNVSNVSNFSKKQESDNTPPPVEGKTVAPEGTQLLEKNTNSGYIGHNGYKLPQTQSPQGVANVSTVDTTLDTNLDTFEKSVFFACCRGIKAGGSMATDDVRKLDSLAEKYDVATLETLVKVKGGDELRGFSFWKQQRAIA